MEQADYSEQEHTKTSTNQDTFPTRKSKRSDKTKRFSDEQVKSLEFMFHRGAKLEPRNKQQLAKDLGLQPRQVSIWFQNKRARWKSKKIEQEYAVLKADFDALCGRYESLKKENESLLEQLGRLNRILENPVGSRVAAEVQMRTARTWHQQTETRILNRERAMRGQRIRMLTGQALIDTLESKENRNVLPSLIKKIVPRRQENNGGVSSQVAALMSHVALQVGGISES